ncbi:MAG TPA: hypothetical protein VIR33_07705 [Thermopolyspora sp.]
MSVLALLGAVAGAIGSVAVIAGAAVSIARKMAPLWQMADDWRGEPERRGPGGVVTSPARMSVMERLSALETGVKELKETVEAQGVAS